MKKSPKLRFAIFLILFYMFASLLALIALDQIGRYLPFHNYFLRPNYTLFLVFQNIVIVAMLVYLPLNYPDYLLSQNWRINSSKYVSVGLKWTIPILIFYLFSILTSGTWDTWSVNEEYLRNQISKNLTEPHFLLAGSQALMGAVVEEFLFRGILQKKVQSYCHPSISILFTTSIFTFLHCIYSTPKLMSIIAWVTIGIVSGCAFNKTNSCISSIVPHLTSNTLGIALRAIGIGK